MQCPECKGYRHQGPCPTKAREMNARTCEGCGWPLSEEQDRYCHECELEIAEIDAEQAERRAQELRNSL